MYITFFVRHLVQVSLGYVHTMKKLSSQMYPLGPIHRCQRGCPFGRLCLSIQRYPTEKVDFAIKVPSCSFEVSGLQFGKFMQIRLYQLHSNTISVNPALHRTYTVRKEQNQSFWAISSVSLLPSSTVQVEQMFLSSKCLL